MGAHSKSSATLELPSHSELLAHFLNISQTAVEQNESYSFHCMIYSALIVRQHPSKEKENTGQRKNVSTFKIWLFGVQIVSTQHFVKHLEI